MQEEVIPVKVIDFSMSRLLKYSNKLNIHRNLAGCHIKWKKYSLPSEITFTSNLPKFKAKLKSWVLLNIDINP